MKILVTGFEAFGGEAVNAALEVIKKLDNNIYGAEIIKLEVPTVFRKSINIVLKAIDEIKPDYVLSIGQARGRSAITVERIGINIDDAKIPDNEGSQPVDTPIDENGENAYFATIPVKAIVQAIKEKHIYAEISNTAGTFVCNHLMYGVLNYISKSHLNIKYGFIHVPYLDEQVANMANVPCMSLDSILKAINCAIKVMINTKEDLKITGQCI